MRRNKANESLPFPCSGPSIRRVSVGSICGSQASPMPMNDSAAPLPRSCCSSCSALWGIRSFSQLTLQYLVHRFRGFERESRARVGRVASQSAKNHCAMPNSSRLLPVLENCGGEASLPSRGGAGWRDSRSRSGGRHNSGIAGIFGKVSDRHLTTFCSGPEPARFQSREGCRKLGRSWPAAENKR